MSLIQWAAANLPATPMKPIKAFRHLKKIAQQQKKKDYQNMFCKLADEELLLSSRDGKAGPINKNELLNLMRAKHGNKN